MSDFTKLKVKKNSKEYILNVCTQDTEQNIIGTKNFSKLTVNSKNVVTSINDVDADASGNVTIQSGNFMPDYSAGVTKSINVENTAEYDGWLLAKNTADDCILEVTVNNVFTYSTLTWSNTTDGSTLNIFIPLAKGDVYKVTGGGLKGNYLLSCTFFKMR